MWYRTIFTVIRSLISFTSWCGSTANFLVFHSCHVPEPFELVFQSRVSSWLTRGVHPDLHPSAEESRPERYHLPLPDIWSAGIPSGVAPFLFPRGLHRLLSVLLPRLIPSFLSLSLSQSLTFCSSCFLSYHSHQLSSPFCIVIHIPLRFIVSHDTCSILSPRFHSMCLLSSLILHLICLPLAAYLFVALPQSSSALLFPSPSLLFMCVPWWSARALHSPHNH